METGKVSLAQVTSDEEREAFKKWTDGFTRQNHPTEIQVRVSGVISNAPVVLSLDCDTYSNDPQVPRRALCYLLDPQKASKLAFVQVTQRYQGINRYDTYASELKRLYIINPVGMDGLKGTSYVGTGCFFNRHAFYSGPSSSSSSLSPPPPLEVPDYKCNGTMNSCTIRSDLVLRVAHKVAGCNFEHRTSWGSKMDFRYGSLSEDYYTGYRQHCEGWETVFCHPEKAAFLGDIPRSLDDALSQNKRWCVGLLEVAFSKYSPVTFGTTRISLLMGLCYAHYAFWSLWSIPMAAYGFLPQLALLNQFQLFPKVSDPWFYLYVYLFIGAYGQDIFDFLVAGGSIQWWWSDQRMWMIRGITSYLFGPIEFTLNQTGFSATGFNVTSKVIDDEKDKHYRQGIFEFGVPSPLFVPLVMVATINLIAFVVGLAGALMHWNIEDMFVQLFISGFVVVNSWPIYEAMALRKDKGSMPIETTIKSAFLAGLLYLLVYFTFRI
ncbi:hypothetical protein MRB53_035736 [Persea americana]|uniref:Uncharacterized protein n=1 Tax=Persea americana TaxID=3435 RepID=A0ACC2K5W7_PERAE|nr:hypothetical protein MRB53_035736 [Persea americana]